MFGGPINQPKRPVAMWQTGHLLGLDLNSAPPAKERNKLKQGPLLPAAQTSRLLHDLAISVDHKGLAVIQKQAFGDELRNEHFQVPQSNLLDTLLSWITWSCGTLRESNEPDKSGNTCPHLK